MDTWIWVVIIAVLAVWFMKRSGSAKGVRQLTTAELQTELKEKHQVQYVDVRTPMEFKSGHIKKFKNIPLQQLQGRAGELKKDQEIVVICQSGARSNAASKTLKKLGFEKVSNVRGGMSAWTGQRV